MYFILWCSITFGLFIRKTYSLTSYPIISCDFTIDTCGWTVNPPWSLEFTAYIPSPLNLMPRKIQSALGNALGEKFPAPSTQTILLTKQIRDSIQMMRRLVEHLMAWSHTQADPGHGHADFAGGGFLVAQGHFGSEPVGDVILPLQKDNRARILSYKLIKPSGAAKLEILIHDEFGDRILDTVTGCLAVNWEKASTIIPPMERHGNLIFRISSVYDSFDFIGIDDVTVSEVTSNVMSAGSEDRQQNPQRVDTAVFRRLQGVKEIRRSPIKNVLATCKAIRCSFDRSSCAWTYSGFRPLDGKMVSETEGAGHISTEPVLLPLNGHFQMDVFASEHTIVSIIQKIGSREELLWTQSGLLMQKGWNKIRMPLRFSNLPSSIEIKTHTASGQFVAVTNTNLVDEMGRDLACGLNIPAIRPQRDDSTIRLTAVQQLDNDSEESNSDKNSLKSTERLVDPRPMSIETGVQAPMPHTSFKEPQLSSHTIASSMIRAQKRPSVIQNQRELPGREWATGYQQRSRHEPVVPAISAKTPPPMVVRAGPTVTESSLAEQLLAENPQIRHQLKLLAKRFGLEGLSSEDLAARLGSMAKLLGMKPEANPAFKPPNGAQPITPINNSAENPLSKALPNLNGALVSQLSKFLELPASNNIESRPFTRQNMDLIVQNAFNKYMQNARP